MYFVITAVICNKREALCDKVADWFFNQILQGFATKKLQCFVIKFDAFCNERMSLQRPLFYQNWLGRLTRPSFG